MPTPPLLPMGRAPGWHYPSPTNGVGLPETLDKSTDEVFKKIVANAGDNLIPFYKAVQDRHKSRILDAALRASRPTAQDMQSLWRKTLAALAALPPVFGLAPNGYSEANALEEHAAVVARLAQASPLKSGNSKETREERAVRSLDALWEGPALQNRRAQKLFELQPRHAAVRSDPHMPEVLRYLALAVQFSTDMATQLRSTAVAADAAPADLDPHQNMVGPPQNASIQAMPIEDFVVLRLAFDYTLLRLRKNLLGDGLAADDASIDQFSERLFNVKNAAIDHSFIWVLKNVSTMHPTDKVILGIIVEDVINIAAPSDEEIANQNQVHILNQHDPRINRIHYEIIIGVAALIAAQEKIGIYGNTLEDPNPVNLFTWLKKAATETADSFKIACTALGNNITADATSGFDYGFTVPGLRTSQLIESMVMAAEYLGASHKLKAFLNSAPFETRASADTAALPRSPMPAARPSPASPTPPLPEEDVQAQLEDALDALEATLDQSQIALESMSGEAEQKLAQTMRERNADANDIRVSLGIEPLEIDPMLAKQTMAKALASAIQKSLRTTDSDMLERIVQEGNLPAMRALRDQYHDNHITLLAQTTALEHSVDQAWSTQQQQDMRVVFEVLQKLEKAIAKLALDPSPRALRRDLCSRIERAQEHIADIESKFPDPLPDSGADMGIHEQIARQEVHHLDRCIAQWRKKAGPDYRISGEVQQTLATQSWHIHQKLEPVWQAFQAAPAGSPDEQRLAKVYHYLWTRKKNIGAQFNIQDISPDKADLSNIEALTGQDKQRLKAIYSHLWDRLVRWQKNECAVYMQADNTDPFKRKERLYPKAQMDMALKAIGPPPEAPPVLPEKERKALKEQRQIILRILKNISSTQENQNAPEKYLQENEKFINELKIVQTKIDDDIKIIAEYSAILEPYTARLQAQLITQGTRAEAIPITMSMVLNPSSIPSTNVDGYDFLHGPRQRLVALPRVNPADIPKVKDLLQILPERSH
jgi:hypothetical protein